MPGGGGDDDDEDDSGVGMLGKLPTKKGKVKQKVVNVKRRR